MVMAKSVYKQSFDAAYFPPDVELTGPEYYAPTSPTAPETPSGFDPSEGWHETKKGQWRPYLEAADAVVAGDGATIAGGGLPAGVAAALTGLGLTALIAPLAAAYGVSQAIGVQYPWETGPGEGFIAPWSRDIVQDESGRWVTRETRPDLFNGNGNGVSTALVPTGAAPAVLGAPVIVKRWSANGWPFAMDSTGRIHTVTRAGVHKSWRPYKSVVLGKNPSTRQLNGAIRKMVAFDKTHERIKKLARRLKT